MNDKYQFRPYSDQMPCIQLSQSNKVTLQRLKGSHKIIILNICLNYHDAADLF